MSKPRFHRRTAVEIQQLDVEAARKALYPSIGIESMVGYQTFDVAKLVNTPYSLLLQSVDERSDEYFSDVSFPIDPDSSN